MQLFRGRDDYWENVIRAAPSADHLNSHHLIISSAENRALLDGYGQLQLFFQRVLQILEAHALRERGIHLCITFDPLSVLRKMIH